MGEYMQAIIGKKLTMSQSETSDGRRVAVTKISAGPVTVTGLKDDVKDGYFAVQLGFGSAKKLNKSVIGQIKNPDIKPEVIKEVRLTAREEVNIGDKFQIGDVFKAGEVVDVTAIAKGKGFAGGIKRHGFHGGPKTHGQSDRHRAPGSIGSTTTPGRVLKGKRMAGRMGGGQITTQGLEVIEVDAENNVLVVKGAVPGPTGAAVLITRSDKKRKTYHGPQAQALPQGDEVETAPVAGEIPASAAPAQPAGESNG